MFEIRTRQDVRNRTIFQIVAVILLIEGLLYILIYYLLGSPIAFYFISGFMILMISPIIIIGALPTRFTIDEGAGVISSCFKRTCVKTLKLTDVDSVKYSSGNEENILMIYSKQRSDLPSILIRSPEFSGEDVKSAFEHISALSDRYGFDVKESYGPVTSALDGPAEMSVESRREGAQASEDMTPYRVK